MITWQENQAAKLFLENNNQDELFNKIKKFTVDLGFESCAYTIHMPLPLSQPKIIMFDSFPLALKKIYSQSSYNTISQNLKPAMKSLVPVVWSSDSLPPDLILWQDAYSFGQKVGWCQSCKDKNGVDGMLVLTRSTEKISAIELKSKNYQMSWLCQVCHMTMAEILTKKMLPNSSVKLSEREVEVLRWTADGKTSADISDILLISERTVNFHINNTMKKMNTPNKTATVVQAALLGLLS